MLHGERMNFLEAAFERGGVVASFMDIYRKMWETIWNIRKLVNKGWNEKLLSGLIRDAYGIPEVVAGAQ